MDINMYPNSDYTLKSLSLPVPQFQVVADTIGLPIDQVRFLFSQLFALIIAYLFRVIFHPSNVSAASRHWTALSAGLCLSYFCFGKQILLAIGLVILCYCILNLLPPTIFHHATLCGSITFLTAVHIHHQVIEDEGFSIDIAGPLMIIVQKATSLAYSLNDGMLKEDSKLTTLQKEFLVKSKPSALEYFSYLFCYHSVLVGPFFMFTEYQDFIEGNQYLRYEVMKKEMNLKDSEDKVVNNNRTAGNNNLQSNYIDWNGVSEECCTEKHCHTHAAQEEPNPWNATLNKLLGAIVCFALVVIFSPIFPVRRLAEASFVDSSVPYILAYILIATTLRRQLYYAAWLLSDAVCSLSGLGFSGYDEHGKAKWNLVSNINVLGVEFGTSLRSTMESWNIGTMKWLRFLVYERASQHKTLLTYLLSSIWHGFYPGYYLTFLGGAFFTVTSRIIRRSIRPRIMKAGSAAKRVYDFATFIATRLCLSYITFPFVVLKFWPSIAIYRALKFYLHISGLVAIVLMSIAFPPLKDAKHHGNKNGTVSENVSRKGNSTVDAIEGEPDAISKKAV